MTPLISDPHVSLWVNWVFFTFFVTGVLYTLYIICPQVLKLAKWFWVIKWSATLDLILPWRWGKKKS